jgi:hypothetical protein
MWKSVSADGFSGDGGKGTLVGDGGALRTVSSVSLLIFSSPRRATGFLLEETLQAC